MPEREQVTPTPRPEFDKRPSVRVTQLANQQDGLVSRDQLLARGISGSMLSRWVVEGDVEITTATRCGRAVSGIKVHQTLLLPEDIASHEGLPVTSVARTIVDLARRAKPHTVQQALERAMLLRLYDQRAIDRAVDRSYGRHHLPVLIKAIGCVDVVGGPFRSNTERHVRDRLVAAGLPRPEVNAWVPYDGGSGCEVDLLWRRERLVVEIDGPHHLLPHRRAADAERDRRLTSAGFRVRRFPVAQIDQSFTSVTAAVGALFQTSVE